MAARKGASWEVAAAKLEQGVASGDPWAEVVLGHVRSDQGDDRAEASYSHAISAFEAVNSADGLAQARFGLANFRWHKGTSAQEVRALLELALENANNSGDKLLIATAKAQLARHRWRTSDDLDAAWLLASDAERVAFPDGPYQLKLLVLHTLSGIAELTARPDEELDLRRRMVTLAAEEGDAYVEANARANVAQLYLNSPDDAPAGAAESEARLALSAGEHADNAYGQAGAWCTLGRALGPANAEAGPAWQHCIDGYLSVGAPEAALYGKSGLATVQFRSDPDLALRTADAAIADAHTAGAKDAELEARLVAAALRWQAGAPDAESATEAVIADMEAMRDKQGTEEGQASVGAMWRYAYDLLATKQLDAGEVSSAFSVLERLRARELREQLAEAGEPASGAPATMDIPASSGGSEDVLAAVQATLSPDEALVSYELPAGQTLVADSPARSWALVVTRAGVNVVDIPAAAGLSARIEAWLGLLRRRDESGESSRPFATWTDPVVAALSGDISRVIVVPDGALQRAPLAGAFDGGRPEGRYVSVVPSAAVWRQLRDKNHEGKGVLAVADANLPRATDEVHAAVTRLGGTVLAPGDATPAGLAAAKPANFAVLHFATHALADVTHPEKSELHLGEGSILHPRDIAALALTGQVVVLSSCSGAEGRALGGEGVLGLARSFLAGGARVVVGSRWPMKDTESSALVEDFEDALADGLAVDSALVVAQRAAIDDGRPVAAWAGFMAVGDGSVVPFPGGVPRPVRWPVVGFALGLIGLAVAALTQVRRRTFAG